MKLLDMIKWLESQPDKTDIEKLKSGIHILDIGCNLGNYWWDLYEKLNFQQIMGIDKYSQFDLSQNGKWSTISYNSYLNAKGAHTQISNESIFKNTFDFKQIDIDAFFTTDYYLQKVYDLVIVSNFLYLFEKDQASNLMAKVWNALSDSGYVYIHLASEDFQFPVNRPVGAPEEDRIKFSLTKPELEKMTFPLKTICANKYGEYRDILCKKM